MTQKSEVVFFVVASVKWAGSLKGFLTFPSDWPWKPVPVRMLRALEPLPVLRICVYHLIWSSQQPNKIGMVITTSILHGRKLRQMCKVVHSSQDLNLGNLAPELMLLHTLTALWRKGIHKLCGPEIVPRPSSSSMPKGPVNRPHPPPSLLAQNSKACRSLPLH